MEQAVDEVKKIVKEKPKSRFFAATALLLDTAAFALAIIAVATTKWSFNEDTGAEEGLFAACATRNTDCVGVDSEPWRQASAAFLIMGIILSFVGLLTTLLTVCGKGKGLHIKSCVALSIAGIFLLIGCAVFTGSVNAAQTPNVKYGFSMALGWSATVICLFAAPLSLLGDYEQN